MRAVVTGATGFLGAHVAKQLCDRGDDVKVVYRDAERLQRLKGLEFRRAKADVMDFKAMRRALKDAEVLFHTVGFVGSRPATKVWQLNAQAPVVAVEAAAAEGVKRVVLTSTISAIGPAANGKPADESVEYPDDWLGLAYPDSKHQGEINALDAGERYGVEVVIVNPAYLLGVPIDRSQPGETSTRTVGNYLRGRLPGVVASHMNFADVADAAAGHVLAADKGRDGERYILGGENASWPELIDMVIERSGIRHPILVLPTESARVARVREALGLPSAISTEGYALMAQDWRFTSAKAERELGYRARPLQETVYDTVDWYLELMDSGVFDGAQRSGMSAVADVLGNASRLGLLTPVRLAQKLTGKRVIAGT